MGFFRNLWDEALAGPTSDSGVGRFRRYNSLISRTNIITPPTEKHVDDVTPVSRSITILRTNSLSSSGSTPSSPAPLSATSRGGDFKKLTRRKSTADVATRRRESRSLTGYDWIVLTSLER